LGYDIISGITVTFSITTQPTIADISAVSTIYDTGYVGINVELS
jgi:hypothetical protein